MKHKRRFSIVKRDYLISDGLEKDNYEKVGDKKC